MAEELIRTRFFNDANLVSYWRLEGNSNDSKGTNNGTDTNITYGTGYGKFGQGAYNSGGGVNKLITIPSSTSLISPTTGLTISFWMNHITGLIEQTVPISMRILPDPTPPWNIYLFELYPTTISFGLRTANGYAVALSNTTISINIWHHVVGTYDGISIKLFLNGILIASSAQTGNITYSSNRELRLLDNFQQWGQYYTGYLDDIALFSRALSASEVSDLYQGTKSKYVQGKPASAGTLVKNNDSSLGTDLVAWKKFQTMLMKSVNGGTIFSKEVVSTYSLVNTLGYFGGVLAPNGDIHFIQHTSAVGQKISSTGVVSTYSLVYTNSGGGYVGGVLAPNGDIHFVPLVASVGQKVNINGVVSTYSLVYTNSGGAYLGGVLAANGDIHFVPLLAPVGQKISASGVVSTYSLVYTVNASYAAGILDPSGYTHFVPRNSTVGQKISATGVVSTYSLVYTVANAYVGGVLAPNGDIHFVPFNATKGQKVSSTGVVSTYSLVYTSSDAFAGGVLAPNGDIHFVPYNAVRGQKISVSGVVSTYSLTYTTGNAAFVGGTLSSNGDIHFIPRSAIAGQKISTFPAIPFSQTVCRSPFFNKF